MEDIEMKRIITLVTVILLCFAFASRALAVSRTYSEGGITMSKSPSQSIAKSSDQSWSNVKIRPTRLQYIGPSGPVYTYNYHRARLTDYGGANLGGRIDVYLNKDAVFSSTAANESNELRVKLYNRYYLATNSPSENKLYTDGAFSGIAS